MTRVYVGNLDSRVTEGELEDEFRVFGVIRSVWVARRPPGYAFIDFDDRRDAQDAIRELDAGITVHVHVHPGVEACHPVAAAIASLHLIVDVRKYHTPTEIVSRSDAEAGA
ncbi:RNA recognition motif domain, partial [Dillenia turbinata]